MKFLLALSLSIMMSSGFAATALMSKVHFTKPLDNEVVPQTFQVEFEVDGMTVSKAGKLEAGTGHHHIIIDGKPVARDTIVPKDDTHKHFGDGATSTTLTLKPGKHTLTLQFADGMHKSYGEEYSQTISVVVK